MTERPHTPRPAPRSSLVALGLVATLALLAACGAPAPVPSIDVALDASAVAVVRGGSTEVDVVLTRSGGASGPVALSVTGLPANVSASFAPPSLDGGATTSVLTLTATAAATEGTTVLTVSGDGASLSDEATLSLDVESLTVAGRVERLFGLPYAGVTVASQGETTSTGAGGAFELEGLSIPYELTLSAAVGSGAVHVYEDLTTAAPVLKPVFALDLGLSGGLEATVAGDVLGGAAVGVDRVVIICAEGLGQMVIGCDFANTGDTAYLINLTWFSSPSASVRVHALHVEFAADDTPAAYLGYETFDVSLADTDAEVRDLALSPVASVLVEGSIEADPGMTVGGVFGSVRFGPNLSMPMVQSTALVGDISLLVPVPAGATYDLTAIATGPTGSSLAWAVDLSGDFGTLNVPAPLAQGTPADAAVGVNLATPFTSSGSDEVRTYFFTGTGPALAITTTRDSVTVPNPALGGFAFPAAAPYTWYVFGHGISDADAALSRGLLDYFMYTFLFSGGGPGYDQNGSFTLGLDRDFTFAP